MFSCRWWAWTAELRTRTKQSYPCSSRNLNQSSWVRSLKHGHFQVFFWYVCNPLFMVLCVGVLYPYLLAFVANIYFNADTHIIVLHPNTYIYALHHVVIWKLTLLCTLLLIALFCLKWSPIFVLQEYSLWRCAPRYLLWASFAMRTRTSGIVICQCTYTVLE